MAPKTKLLVFTLTFGVVVFLFLGFVEIGPLYAIRYLVFLVALAVYIAVVAVWEAFRKKSRPIGRYRD